MRANRSAAVPPSPNSRSNTTRGLISMGSGVVGVRQRNRIHVGATVAAVARADQPGHVFGGQFERWEARVLADLLRRHLIDGGAGANVFALGASWRWMPFNHVAVARE